MTTKSLFFVVGFGLTILGGFAGVALFLRAVRAKEKDPAGQSTLWGLFLVGIIGGLILLVLSMGR
jgi:hypothetical protein